jgi:glycosyltransferase involved in cell wall biosynthesis
MRVLQLIDSLDAGGAERIAVSYANALTDEIEFSGLIATRKEGQLYNQLNKSVSYLFLNKKRAIDFKSVFRLRRFIIKNQVAIIHAHGTSFFIAILVKLVFPKIRIIWHDHYGARSKESKSKNKVLIFCSFFFSSIIAVNLQLKEWSQKNMLCKKVVFIPNFAAIEDKSKQTVLKGSENKRIVFLANLKNPKNHIAILKAFHELKLKDLGWTLHLIGRDYEDNYSQALKDFVNVNLLSNYIYIYGNRSDIQFILSQASVGILASTEEGFPVTLLEYALAGLAVVSSNVGYCSEIIDDEVSGLLFDPFNGSEIKEKLIKIIENEPLRNVLAENFRQNVNENYSEEMVIEKLMTEYRK